MPGLFDAVLRGMPRRPGPRNAPMAPAAAPGGPPVAPGWMGAGGGAPAPGGAPDASGRALQQYGPNGLLALQIMQAMMHRGPGGVMDPQNASQWFTPETIGGLAPRYQAAYRKQTKGK